MALDEGRALDDVPPLMDTIPDDNSSCSNSTTGADIDEYFEDDMEEGRANLNAIDIAPILFTARGDVFSDETAPSSNTDVDAPAVDDDPDVPCAQIDRVSHNKYMTALVDASNFLLH